MKNKLTIIALFFCLILAILYSTYYPIIYSLSIPLISSENFYFSVFQGSLPAIFDAKNFITEYNPPGYFVFGWILYNLGIKSVFSFRLISGILFLLGLFFIGKIVWKEFSPIAAGIFFFLSLKSNLILPYAPIIRYHSLLLFLVCFSTWILYLLYKKQINKFVAFCGLSIYLALMGLTHLTGFLFAFCFLLVLFFIPLYKRSIVFLIAIISFFLSLPAIFFFIFLYYVSGGVPLLYSSNITDDFLTYLPSFFISMGEIFPVIFFLCTPIIEKKLILFYSFPMIVFFSLGLFSYLTPFKIFSGRYLIPVLPFIFVCLAIGFVNFFKFFVSLNKTI